MSNTPTESEFDKELDHIMGWCSGIAHSPCWYDENIIGKNLTGYDEDMLAKEAIKRAVDKPVIGEKPYYDDEDAYADEKRGMHNLIDEQHINLYGGDKK